MRRIAIIDDDHTLSDGLLVLIEGLGDIVVSQAFDQEAGVTLVSEESFDVVVLDIDLGGSLTKYGGFAILNKLSAKKIPTLVVSGASEKILEEVTLLLDAYDFIAKPISNAAFIHKLQHALESSHQEKTESASNTAPQYPIGLERDPQTRFVFKWHGDKVKLTMTQARLVECLIETPDKTVPYATLLKQLGNATNKSALATHFSGIRSRFSDVDSKFNSIRIEPGKGYAWKTST